MKMRFEFPGETPPTARQRGAAPVGHLHELPPVELAEIVYLRAWCEGGTDREMIARDFRLVMGSTAGRVAVGAFDALMATLSGCARRPIMHHGLGCRCFGGDESAFANMVAAAAGQDRDDAMLFAGTLMRGDAAWAAVRVALRLEQVFLRLARVPDAPPEPTHGPEQTSHRH
ncbi:MAG: hypothetical protein WBA25_05100 [Jannaschia sp.]